MGFFCLNVLIKRFLYKNVFLEFEKKEHPERFVEVSNSDVKMFIKGEENINTKRNYNLKACTKFLVEERHKIMEIEITPTSSSSMFLLKWLKREKIMNLHLFTEFCQWLNTIWVVPIMVTELSLKTVISTQQRRVESETKGTQATWTRKQTKRHTTKSKFSLKKVACPLWYAWVYKTNKNCWQTVNET